LSATSFTSGAGGPNLSPAEKLRHFSWGLLLAIIATACLGFAMLYSAADGNADPWMSRQATRFAAGVVVLFIVALVDFRFWLRYAYGLYALAMALLVGVEIAGHVGMGAQRWISIGPVQLQPSEMMKIALVLALARYFHGQTYEDIGRPLRLIIPTAMVFLPAGLVLMQPDLGTAGMLILDGALIFFLAGVRLWKFAVVALAAVSAVPVGWKFLHGYQKERLLSFLDPENDPLGTGYHILQSKIAFGSGGLFGRGFLQGSQSHLSFLPERQTDFIFTMLAEEFGMVGGLVLLGLYTVLIGYGMAIALRSRNQFGRLVAMGLSGNLFFYVFINMAMVMGLIPVVGVPLPLISYGGTAMLTVLAGFGLIMAVYVNRDLRIGRRGGVAED
jgi:rod shape determining protein RodA